jgi:hypothetical protein
MPSPSSHTPLSKYRLCFLQESDAERHLLRSAYLWMVQLYANGARRRPRCVASTLDVACVMLRHYCATLSAKRFGDHQQMNSN